MKKIEHNASTYKKILDIESLTISLPEDMPRLDIYDISNSVIQTVKRRMKKILSACDTLEDFKKIADYVSFGESKISIELMPRNEDTTLIAGMLNRVLTKPAPSSYHLTIYEIYVTRQDPSMISGKLYGTMDGNVPKKYHLAKFEVVQRNILFFFANLVESFTAVYLDNVAYAYAVNNPSNFEKARALILKEKNKQELYLRYRESNRLGTELDLNLFYVPENIDSANMIQYLLENYEIKHNVHIVKSPKFNDFGINSLVADAQMFNKFKRSTALAAIVYFNETPCKVKIRQTVEQKKIYETNRSLTKKTLRLMNETTLLRTFQFVELANGVEAGAVAAYEKAIEEIATTIPLELCKGYSLRIKKLGKRRADGIYYAGSIKSILIDVRRTVAFIHELGHLIDSEYMDLSGKDEFSAILEAYRNYLNSLRIKPFSVEKRDYYLSATECFARAFEIYAYQKGLRTPFNDTALDKYLYPMEDKTFVENICTYFDNLFASKPKAL